MFCRISGMETTFWVEVRGRSDMPVAEGVSGD
jgi:hypothetical protein